MLPYPQLPYLMKMRHGGKMNPVQQYVVVGRVALPPAPPKIAVNGCPFVSLILSDYSTLHDPNLNIQITCFCKSMDSLITAAQGQYVLLTGVKFAYRKRGAQTGEVQAKFSETFDSLNDWYVWDEKTDDLAIRPGRSLTMSEGHEIITVLKSVKTALDAASTNIPALQQGLPMADASDLSPILTISELKPNTTASFIGKIGNIFAVQTGITIMISDFTRNDRLSMTNATNFQKRFPGQGMCLSVLLQNYTVRYAEEYLTEGRFLKFTNFKLIENKHILMARSSAQSLLSEISKDSPILKPLLQRCDEYFDDVPTNQLTGRPTLPEYPISRTSLSPAVSTTSWSEVMHTPARVTRSSLRSAASASSTHTSYSPLPELPSSPSTSVSNDVKVASSDDQQPIKREFEEPLTDNDSQKKMRLDISWTLSEISDTAASDLNRLAEASPVVPGVQAVRPSNNYLEDSAVTKSVKTEGTGIEHTGKGYNYRTRLKKRRLSWPAERPVTSDDSDDENDDNAVGELNPVNVMRPAKVQEQAGCAPDPHQTYPKDSQEWSPNEFVFISDRESTKSFSLKEAMEHATDHGQYRVRCTVWSVSPSSWSKALIKRYATHFLLLARLMLILGAVSNQGPYLWSLKLLLSDMKDSEIWADCEGINAERLVGCRADPAMIPLLGMRMSKILSHAAQKRPKWIELLIEAYSSRERRSICNADGEVLSFKIINSCII
ncbi:uncharacterized protein V1518DRAFT_417783 [Limtongia smithiae]|uniref:uncharacterized protein n=1 Tax=Limtongia smithiae TaxID=1125753 RepID=UPI0034CDBB92